jgi:hypothetical protein
LLLTWWSLLERDLWPLLRALAKLPLSGVRRSLRHRAKGGQS